jgi:hypothetical protein
MCTLTAAAAADGDADYDHYDLSGAVRYGLSADTLGVCVCSGDVARIGLTPHTNVLDVMLQQQGSTGEHVSCAPDMHSLVSKCSEDTPIVGASFTMCCCRRFRHRRRCRCCQ